jgi:hypothetical protein
MVTPKSEPRAKSKTTKTGPTEPSASTSKSAAFADRGKAVLKSRPWLPIAASGLAGLIIGGGILGGVFGSQLASANSRAEAAETNMLVCQVASANANENLIMGLTVIEDYRKMILDLSESGRVVGFSFVYDWTSANNAIVNIIKPNFDAFTEGVSANSDATKACASQ